MRNGRDEDSRIDDNGMGVYIIKKIDVEGLRRLGRTECLVLKGCSGDLQEWVDGINGLLKEEGVLQDDIGISDVYVFENAGRTDLLFSLDEDRMDMGKLAIWRLKTHPEFGGTWLSDYLENQSLSNSMKLQQKPDCPLIGLNGNIFSLMGAASRSLNEYGQAEQAREMVERIIHGDCRSYDCALNIIGEYVNITSTGTTEDMGEEDMGMKMGNQ